MSEPITEPGERTRREYEAKLDAKNAELSREKTQLALIGIEYAIKDLGATLAHHIDDDKRIQAELKSSVSSLSGKVSGAISGVNTLNGDKKMIQGAWKAITIVGILGATIAGAFSKVIEHLMAFFSKGAP